MNSPATMNIFRKLEILSDAAKYDVACTSSGVARGGKKGTMGNTTSGGICHCFSADGRCISLLKVLYTNECTFDCKYCVNRCSRDVERASFTPEELAELTISFYKRNYIEGLFLSSGIHISPNHTMDQIYQAIYLLRNQYQFNGYIHVKAIPGADPLLIEKVGWLADRMSINLELPTSDGLRALAPNKTRKTILRPMKQIQLGREQLRQERHPALSGSSYPMLGDSSLTSSENTRQASSGIVLPDTSSLTVNEPVHGLTEYHENSRFVPAGQSTQMIIGATGETDYEIVKVSEALYQNFNLKRVFYSAFINTTKDASLPTIERPPLLREHRLYQADFLLRFYGFSADEILSAEHPHLNVALDPKCNWAMNHLEFFPVEIHTASYQTLLRVPGIGVKSARRIVAARRQGRLRFEDLKKIGVVLKRAVYFITCSGKMMYSLRMSPNFIMTGLLGVHERLPAGIEDGIQYEQLCLDDLIASRSNPLIRASIGG